MRPNMRTVALFIIMMVFGMTAFGGTNVIGKIVLDNLSQEARTGMRMESYSCGTNELLKIIRDGKSTIIKLPSGVGSTDAVTKHGNTRVTSSGADYTISLDSISTNGVSEITISKTNGTILESLRRDSGGNYDATPQEQLDEINDGVKRIQKNIPKASNPTNQIPVTTH